MTGPQALPLVVSLPQQAVLERLLRQHSCPQALVRRVKIILAAAAGQPNVVIARHLACSPVTVRLWRTRWVQAAPALAAQHTADEIQLLIATILADAPRCGAPDTFSAEQLVQIIALACTPPADSGRPVEDWTPRELADEAVKREIVAAISPRSVGRFLKAGLDQASFEPLLAHHEGD